MLLKDNGDIENASEGDSVNSMLSLQDVEEDVEYPVQRQFLVVRRTLNVQVKQEDSNQKENIFHTRCLVNGNVCNLIIDGEVVPILTVLSWLINLGWPARNIPILTDYSS